jgi:Domain of unknown function (DUF1844)
MAEKKHEQSGFKVTDRRLFTSDGELRSDAPEEVEAPKAAPAPVAAPAPQEVAAAETIQAPVAGETPERELPIPPTSAEQEAQAAAYRQSAKDLDSQVELSGHSATEFEMTFERFLASLYMTAMMQLGLMRQQGEQPRIDIIGARQSIDLLGVLGEKTKGNVNEREKQFLQNALFDVRMMFLELTKAIAAQAKRPPAGSPLK